MEETTSAEKDVAIRKTDGSLIPLMPEDAEGVFRVSKYLAASDLIPKSFGGRAENVFAAIMYGREIGVSAMQSLSNIAVVNGRPSVWGELATALVRQSGFCEALEYKFTGTGATLKCIATGKRKGVAEAHTEEFSMEDAKLAGFDKKETYTKHPKDMIMWKALHRLYKFLWADVLKGLSIREIVKDEVLEAEVVPQVMVEAPVPETIAPEGPKKAQTGRPARSKNKPKEPTQPESMENPTIPAVEALAEIPVETPAEAAKETLPLAPPAQLERVVGTLVTAVKLNDPATAAVVGFAAKVLTKAGEVKYLFESYEVAIAAKPFTGKTVMLWVEKFKNPITGVLGKIVKYEPVNP